MRLVIPAKVEDAIGVEDASGAGIQYKIAIPMSFRDTAILIFNF